MEFIVNTEKLKRSIAYTDSADLLYTLKREADNLYRHNKNLTKSQYYSAEMLQAFIECLLIKTDSEYIYCFTEGIAPKNPMEKPCENCPFNKKCGSYKVEN